MPKPPAQNRSVPSILAVLVLGLSAIYLVPFHVPVHDGLSDSWLFGFNNRAATLLLFLFAIGFALWTRGLGLRLPDRSQRLKDSFRSTGVMAIACSLLAATLIWLAARTLSPFDEAMYFLDRYATFGMGAHLYTDFGFDYGPLMFYPPIWLAHLCHISVANSYYITWIAEWTLGVWLLWKVVGVAARGTSHGRAIFLLLWIFFLTTIPDGGLNYTPLRFCGTLGFALGVHSLLLRKASNFAIFGLACIGATTMLLYSPEQGIAFTLGTILFFAICVRHKDASLLKGLCCFAFVMALVFWAALRLGVLGNITTVGAGTLNFPILFSFQSLVLLLLLIVAACAMIASLRTNTSSGPLLYWICLSLVSAPAAFSRADPGHIIVNTLGALIAALVILSQYPAFWRWVWPSFAVLILLSTYGKFTYFQGAVRTQIHEAIFGTQYYSPGVDKAYTAIYKLTHRNAQVRLDNLRTLMEEHGDPGMSQLPPQSHLLAPLGFRRRLTPVPDGIQIVTGRYPWLFPMTSTAIIPQKIAEIEAHPDWPLLLPSREPQVCVFDPQEQRQTLRKLLLAPYLPAPQRTVTAAKPFCDYLNTHFAPGPYASPVPHYYVWVRTE